MIHRTKFRKYLLFFMFNSYINLVVNLFKIYLKILYNEFYIYLYEFFELNL